MSYCEQDILHENGRFFAIRIRKKTKRGPREWVEVHEARFSGGAVCRGTYHFPNDWEHMLSRAKQRIDDLVAREGNGPK